jgi:hypothetical protein
VGNHLAHLAPALCLHDDVVTRLHVVVPAKVEMIELPEFLEAYTYCVGHFLSRSTGLATNPPDIDRFCVRFQSWHAFSSDGRS